MTHIAGPDATTHLALIEALIGRTRGDQLEPCVPPEPGWLSECDMDVRAGKDEDRTKRSWR